MHRRRPSRDVDSVYSLAIEEQDYSHMPAHLPTRTIMVLTCAVGGVQLIWSTVFSHGSAYLFTLRITKSQSSLIWAIAPLCGALVQPVVGALSDLSESRWGRRRPFVLGGALGVAVALMALAWVRGIAGAVADVLGIRMYDEIGEGGNAVLQVCTILCVVVLNLGMQPLQAGLRALIVDVCPSEQQIVCSAWAGRFGGASNILGYILGSLPLGDGSEDEMGRFRSMALLSVACLVVTVLVTVYFIREEDASKMEQEEDTEREANLVLRLWGDVRDGWQSMPLQSRRVCFVQFFAWMGWFGFLFYSTSYISSLYIVEERQSWTQDVEHLKDAGVRLGTFASLLSAAMALITAIVAPNMVSARSRGIQTHGTSRGEWWRQTHIIWFLGHLLYAVCMFSTFFVCTTTAAIVLITLTGIAWGITQWAPFALIGEDIAMYDAERSPTVEKGGRKCISSRSGAMMGVHNAAISLPQILAAMGSSFVFWVFEDKGSGDDNSVAWVLRASGAVALTAAYLSRRLM